jgi:hypothetical protein
MRPKHLILTVATAVVAMSTALPALAATPTPSGMVVKWVSSTEAAVDWNSVWPRDYYVAYLYDAGGTGLRGERSNGPDGNTSSHTWRNLSPCTRYSTDASAVYAGVESGNTNRVSFTTTGCVDPTPSSQPTPAPAPTPEPTPAPTASPEPTASPTPSPEPTPSPDPVSWNGFANPDRLPGAGWRPYMDAAAWNRGTAGATVRPDSATLVDYLRTTSGGRMGDIPVPDDDGSAPVYYAADDDPLYTVHCRLWVSSCEVENVSIRIPKGALPTRAYDRHLVSIQPDGREVDLWQADDPSGSGGDLWVSYGGITRIDGDSTGSDAVAATTGAMAGEFTSASWQADRIDHALQMGILRDNGTYVYPAGKTGASDPITSPIPMGQWFKLEITDAELAAEPPWRRAIYRAMRDYGLFVIDTGADFAIAHENPLTYTSFGAQDPAYDWLRGQDGVAEWTDPSTGTLNVVAKTRDFPFDKLVALEPPPAP